MNLKLFPYTSHNPHDSDFTSIRKLFFGETRSEIEERYHVWKFSTYYQRMKEPSSTFPIPLPEGINVEHLMRTNANLGEGSYNQGTSSAGLNPEFKARGTFADNIRDINYEHKMNSIPPTPTWPEESTPPTPKWPENPLSLDLQDQNSTNLTETSDSSLFNASNIWAAKEKTVKSFEAPEEELDSPTEHQKNMSNRETLSDLKGKGVDKPFLEKTEVEKEKILSDLGINKGQTKIDTFLKSRKELKNDTLENPIGVITKHAETVETPKIVITEPDNLASSSLKTTKTGSNKINLNNRQEVLSDYQGPESPFENRKSLIDNILEMFN